MKETDVSVEKYIAFSRLTLSLYSLFFALPPSFVPFGNSCYPESVCVGGSLVSDNEKLPTWTLATCPLQQTRYDYIHDRKSLLSEVTHQIIILRVRSGLVESPVHAIY